MKIWAIEMGSYSDYHIVGVFSSKENAEMIVSKMDMKYETPNIVEWEVDPSIAELNANMKQFKIIMRKDGSTEKTTELDFFDEYDLCSSYDVWERTKAGAYSHDPQQFPDVLNCTVWARDTEHAIKIVNEVRLQWVVEGKF